MPDLAARRASLFKDLFLRDDTSCPTGEQFYHCGSNGFRGCCSVDPCDLRRCPDLPSKVFVTWTLPGIADADGTATASLPESTTASDDEMLTTKTSTTSKETEVTTTTTIASTRTLTRTHKSTIEEEITSEETTSGEAITQEPETEKTTLTKGTTVTDTKTEPTTLVSVTREATTHTEKHTLTTSHRVLVPLTTSSTIAADRDDVLDTAQDNDEESNDNRKLSPGQIGGTVGGVVVLCILLAVAAFVMLRRRAARRKTQPQPRPVSSNDGSTSDKDYTPVAMTSPSGQDPFAPFGGKWRPSRFLISAQ